MRVVIQRVLEASVKVDGKLISEIGKGMMILYGVEQGDTIEELQWLVKKVMGLRIFDDANGVMNLPITEVEGASILVVSQFTLTASTKKGNRPSYIRAADPAVAIPMYERFCDELSKQIEVRRGVFGVDMKVALINDGPVTIIMDTRIKE